MSLPSQKEFHRPVLEIIGRAVSSLPIRQIMDETSDFLQLTASDKQQVEDNGAYKWEKRVRWATHNLKNFGGLVQSPTYRHYEITTAGRDFLAVHRGDISIRQLKEAKPKTADTQSSSEVGEDIPLNEAVDSEIFEGSDSSPEDLIRAGVGQLRTALTDDLRELLSDLEPTQFELLAIDLLEKMGYGKGEHVGGRGDGGIDGVLRQDPLGLGTVCCVQAKRWNQNVGDDVIRTFSGSIERFGSSFGVVVTTDRFASSAIETARAFSVGNKIIRLIGGQDLITLMIAHGVGVVTENTFEIKRVDTTYFDRS
jgi:restriction system protein